jgi:hypothetical protein
MKTTKFISVLSFALIFIGITAGISKNVENPGYKVLLGTSITYHVIIHTELATNPCGNYLVEVVDETGRLVAPAQSYVPGIDKYSIHERFSTIENPNTRRVAMLVPVVYPDHFICEFPLYTPPDVLVGPFYSGQTYTFNLYPQTSIQPDK